MGFHNGLNRRAEFWQECEETNDRRERVLTATHVRTVWVHVGIKSAQGASTSGRMVETGANTYREELMHAVTVRRAAVPELESGQKNRISSYFMLSGVRYDVNFVLPDKKHPRDRLVAYCKGRCE